MDRSPPSSVQPAEELFFEFLELRERGEAADFELFCARHPQLEAQLRELQSAHAQLVEVASRLGQGRGERSGARADAGEAGGPWARVVARLSARARDGERYEVKGPINRGGMGVIYEVYDRDLRRKLAMKVVRDSGVDARAFASKLGRFLEEAQVTGQLEHPGIVPIHDLGVDALGRVYFTMKLVDGKHLREVFELARKGLEGWTEMRVLQALLRVCEAVEFAHSRGVIHRDLKPENIMVGRFGETYVMDWGLAKLRAQLEQAERAVSSDRRDAVHDSSSASMYTHEGQGVGTPSYMPPEQALGRLDEVDERSDVYALGAILYHLIAGRAPYSTPGELVAGAELLARVIAGPPQALAELAPDAASELVAIADKAMSRSRGARYGSVRDFADDLRAYTEGRVVRAHRTGVVVELRKWIARNRALAAALALALVGGLATAGVEWRRTIEAAQSQLATSRLEAERSAERERLLREQSLAAELATADMAAQRGAWEEVLAAVGRARERGHADEADALCREVEAWIAQSHGELADAGLARLAEMPLSGASQARALVLRAMRLATTTGRQEECIAVATQALAAGASGADRAFVQALLAPTTDGALAHLKAALEIQPYHSLANDLLMSLLILSGRYDEALEQSAQFARLYPDDPRPHSGLAVSLLMLGRRDEALAELERAREGLDADAASSLAGMVEMLIAFGDAPPDSLLDGSLLFRMMPLVQRAAGVASQAQNSSGQLTSFSLVSLSGAFGGFIDCMLENGQPRDALSAVMALATSLRLDPQRVLRCVDVALRHHENGFLYFLAALSHAELPAPAGSELEHHRKTLEYWEKAVQTPSTLPQTRRISAVARTLLEERLARQFGDEAARERVRERGVEFLEVEQPGPLESRLMAGVALDAGRPELAMQIVERARALHPADPELQLERGRVLAANGRFADGLAQFDELLAPDPAAEKSKMKRRALEERQARVRAARERALADWQVWNERSAQALDAAR